MLPLRSDGASRPRTAPCRSRCARRRAILAVVGGVREARGEITKTRWLGVEPTELGPKVTLAVEYERGAGRMSLSLLPVGDEMRVVSVDFGVSADEPARLAITRRVASTILASLLGEGDLDLSACNFEELRSPGDNEECGARWAQTGATDPISPSRPVERRAEPPKQNLPEERGGGLSEIARDPPNLRWCGT